MDLLELVKTLASSPVLSALVTGLVAIATLRFQASRDDHRRHEEWERQDATERIARTRQLLLKSIDETQRAILTHLQATVLIALGGKSALEADFGWDTAQDAALSMVGDREAILAYFRAVRGLAAKHAGDGLTKHEAEEIAVAQNLVTSALQAQRRRATRDEPLREFTRDQLEEILTTMEAEPGFPIL